MGRLCYLRRDKMILPGRLKDLAPRAPTVAYASASSPAAMAASAAPFMVLTDGAAITSGSEERVEVAE